MRKPFQGSRHFDYSRDYTSLDLRREPHLYQVGIGEQGVLLVEPYKSEILPFWRFKDPEAARRSAQMLYRLFQKYKARGDFVGMDMTRKFLQMGYTRSRRYANNPSGRKYAADGSVRPHGQDPVKAASARIFYEAWMQVEADPLYATFKIFWKEAFG